MYEKVKKEGIISDEEYHLMKIYSDRLKSNGVPVIFNLRHLRKILNISKCKQALYFSKERNWMYKRFAIPKRSGGYRVIEAPNEELKARQLWIKKNIVDKMPVSNFAKGFKKNCSIYDNAVKHVGKELVINIDIKDFFPTIKYNQIYKLYRYIGYTNQVAHLLTKLCTNEKNVLPQGAPTSPPLSNMVLLKLDKRLSSLAASIGCEYTRYADDITFSGEKRIKSILSIVIKIINDEGFKINNSKLRFQYANQRQEVTGLIVNKKVSLPSKTLKEIDNAIYYCMKYGVQNHMNRIECNKSFYKEHLYGIAYFIKMIDSDEGNRYLEKLSKISWLY